MASVYNFEITNSDLLVRFSCPNHNRRIAETIRNLCIDTNDPDSAVKKSCRYTSMDANFMCASEKRSIFTSPLSVVNSRLCNKK